MNVINFIKKIIEVLDPKVKAASKIVLHLPRLMNHK